MVVLAPSLSALVVPTMLGAIFVLALVQGLIQWPDETARRRLYQWSIVAFGAHLLFGLASTDISPHIRTYLGSDGFLYDATATKMVQHWTQGMPFPFVPHGKEGFYYLLAGLYWIFGSHTASGLAVNAALAAGLVPLLSDTTHRLFGSAAARYAGPLVVLMPGMFLWSSQLMKESGMLFLLAVALNSAVRLVERVSLTSLCVFTLSLALAFTFRAWVALMVAAGLLAGLVLGRKTLISGLGTGLTTGLVVATVMVASGLGYQGYQAAVSVDLQQATTVRKDLASTAGTGFQGDADISTTSGALTYLPQGMANFMLGPLPWNIRGARQLPFVPDMVVWWCLLPCLWTGYRRAGALVGRQRLVMVLPALATVLLLSLALANYGTVVRERLQVVVLIVPLIALGLSERAARRPEVETSTAGTTALALVGRA
jgi:4-amino-4-deoxy-L-arabinose transferase-like glycosyltransferase